MLFHERRVKKKVTDIIKDSSSVSLIIKYPGLNVPDQLRLVINFMKNESDSFIIGLNYNKKDGSPYFKVLSKFPVIFEHCNGQIAGSRCGSKYSLDDYMNFFSDKRYTYIR